MSAIIPLLVTDLAKPWADEVMCSDSSTEGLGVCVRLGDAEEISTIGSWQERWRFRRLDPSEWKPRCRALDELAEITDPRTVGLRETPDDSQ